MANTQSKFGLMDPQTKAINTIASKIKYYYYDFNKSLMWPDDFYMSLGKMQKRIAGHHLLPNAVAGTLSILSDKGCRTIPGPRNGLSNHTWLSYYGILNTVDLPQCLEIGSSAFHKCVQLSSVNLPDVQWIKTNGITSTLVTSLYLSRLYSLDDYALINNNYLTSMSCYHLRDIGMHIFEGCSQLSSMTFPNVLELQPGQFSGETNWEYLNFSLVETIPSYCFANCNNLQSFIAPFGSTYGEYAFIGAGFSTLINSQATYVKDGCFMSCSKLTMVDLPIVATLGRSVFKDCSKLISVRLDKLPEIYNGTFSGCGQASYYAPIATIIESNTFLSNQIKFIEANKLETVNMSTFANCPNLKSVSMPNLKTIRPFGFYNTPLSSLDMTNLETVQPYGLAKTKLTTIDAPKLKHIEANSFDSCPLVTVNLPVCEFIGGSAFWSNGEAQTGYTLKKVIAPKCKYLEGRALFHLTNTLEYVDLTECEFIGGDTLAWCGTCDIKIRDLVEVADFGINGTNWSNGQSITLSKLKIVRYGAFGMGNGHTFYTDNLEYLNWPGRNNTFYIKNSICRLAHSSALTAQYDGSNVHLYVPKSYWSIYQSREFFSSYMGGSVLSY